MKLRLDGHHPARLRGGPLRAPRRVDGGFRALRSRHVLGWPAAFRTTKTGTCHSRSCNGSNLPWLHPENEPRWIGGSTFWTERVPCRLVNSSDLRKQTTPRSWHSLKLGSRVGKADSPLGAESLQSYGGGTLTTRPPDRGSFTSV